MSGVERNNQSRNHDVLLAPLAANYRDEGQLMFLRSFFLLHFSFSSSPKIPNFRHSFTLPQPTPEALRIDYPKYH